LNDFLKNEKISKLLNIAKYGVLLFIGALLVMRIGECFYTAFTCRWPREYRDVSNIWLTNEFINGRNPYTINDNPIMQAVNVYAPLNSVIAAGIYFVTGINIVAIHYVLDVLYVFAAALTIGYVVWKKTDNIYLSVVALALGWSCGYRFGYVSSIPDHLGMLIWVVIIAVLMLKKPDWKVCTLVAVLSVLSFYAKQYFAVCAAAVVVFLAIRKIRYALLYIAECAVIGLASLEIINRFCPLFSIYNLFLFSVEKSSKNGDGMTYGYSLMQLGVLFERYYYLFIIVISFAAYSIVKRKKHEWDFSEIAFIVMFFPMLVLGKTDGAFLSYHLQMWFPQLIIFAMIIASKTSVEKKPETVQIGQIVIGCCVILTVYLFTKVAVCDENATNNWNRANEYISKACAEGKEVLIDDPTMGYAILENESALLYCNGHNYLDDAFIWEVNSEDNYMGKLLTALGLFDDFDRLKQTVAARTDKRNQLIKEHYFGLIIGKDEEREAEFEDAGYKIIDSVNLITGEQDLGNVDFWMYSGY